MNESDIEARIDQNREWAAMLYAKLQAGDVSAGARLNRCNEAFCDLMEERASMCGEIFLPYRIK